jgi:hypothetical protein
LVRHGVPPTLLILSQTYPSAKAKRTRNWFSSLLLFDALLLERLELIKAAKPLSSDAN